MKLSYKLATMVRRRGLKWKALAVATVMCVAIHSAAFDKKKEEAKVVKPNLTPLMIAALSCNGNEVATLLGQGADAKALDARGNDALTFASVQRTKDLILECPDVVTALTKAGADPWTANFYQNPELERRRPSKIAVLRVEDARAAKDDRSKGFAEGVEQALSQGRPRYTPVVTPHYPIMRQSETREKLRAAGFSEEEIMHPDRKRACSVLEVDAVFEAVVSDYAHGLFAENEGIVGPAVGTNREASLEYWLTDCRTGELLWRNKPGTVGVKRSFLATAFLSSYTTICEQSITFPRYQGPEK